MAQVEILESLKKEVMRKFKGESRIIFRQMRSLADHPKKGKLLSKIGGILCIGMNS